MNVTANSTTGMSKVTLRKNGKLTGLSVYIIEGATGLFETTTESEIVVASDILDYYVETGAGGSLNIERVTLQKDGDVYPLKRV